MDVNIPDVVDAVRKAHARYEKALVESDVAVLNELFWNSPHTVRFGFRECLFGYDQIRAYRSSSRQGGHSRNIHHAVVTSFGHDFATTSIDLDTPSSPGKISRQSQSWVRMPEGWRIVAAHVSVIDAP